MLPPMPLKPETLRCEHKADTSWPLQLSWKRQWVAKSELQCIGVPSPGTEGRQPLRPVAPVAVAAHSTCVASVLHQPAPVFDGRCASSQRRPYCCPVVAVLYPEPRTRVCQSAFGSTVFSLSISSFILHSSSSHLIGLEVVGSNTLRAKVWKCGLLLGSTVVCGWKKNRQQLPFSWSEKK